MQGNTFTMHFEGAERLELIRSEFRPSSQTTAKPNIAIRGKSAGAFPLYGSFQWTSGVRAVCAVFLRYAISEQSSGVDYCLIGSKGSLAASLDYALSKGPSWIGEMFGATPGGGLYAKRLFRITNPNRKRPGPVALSVNKTLMSGSSVEVFWNGERITATSTLESILRSIENQADEGDDSDDSVSQQRQKSIANS